MAVEEGGNGSSTVSKAKKSDPYPERSVERIVRYVTHMPYGQTVIFHRKFWVTQNIVDGINKLIAEKVGPSETSNKFDIEYDGSVLTIRRQEKDPADQNFIDQPTVVLWQSSKLLPGEEAKFHIKEGLSFFGSIMDALKDELTEVDGKKFTISGGQEGERTYINVRCIGPGRPY